MTVVRPYSQWGIAVIDDADRIEGFREKPRLDYWINGGFFCLEPDFLDHVERGQRARARAARAGCGGGRLAAYRHDGFWDCMDTYKDAIVLNDLWAGGNPPWRRLVARHRRGTEPDAASPSSPARAASSAAGSPRRCSSAASASSRSTAGG